MRMLKEKESRKEKNLYGNDYRTWLAVNSGYYDKIGDRLAAWKTSTLLLEKIKEMRKNNVLDKKVDINKFFETIVLSLIKVITHV